MSEQEPNSTDDHWQSESLRAVQQVAESLRELHQSNPWLELPLLPRAMNHLMTELWDRGFSQSEIRQAFNEAVRDMPRYAAGDEVRP